MSKKIKCYICNEEQKIVGDKVTRWFCWKCTNSHKFTEYQAQRNQEKRLEALRNG